MSRDNVLELCFFSILQTINYFKCQKIQKKMSVQISEHGVPALF